MKEETNKQTREKSKKESCLSDLKGLPELIKRSFGK
jgi:hypothetical protein